MFWPRAHDLRLFTALLLALITLAWVALLVWEQSPYGQFLDHEELAEIELGASSGALGFAALFTVGWTLMTFAMMLPTSLPLIQMFQRMTRQRSNRTELLVLLIAGYIAVWAAFGVIAHAGDWLLHQAIVERVAWIDDHAWVIGAATLGAAGVYQFTPLKYHCLDRCRSPMMFIANHWRGDRDRLRSFQLGLSHGLFCVGCCWSLMLVMFAVGVGNVGWMLVLGAIMAIEKNMPWGKRISGPLGIGLITAAIGVAIVAGGDVTCAC
jgi:predicted metal-binding membrane protein